MKRNPLSFGNRCRYWTELCVWFIVWGGPVGVVGCALCLFILTAPIGLFLIWLAARPLANMVQRRGEEVKKWNALGLTEAELPWMNIAMVDEPWNER